VSLDDIFGAPDNALPELQVYAEFERAAVEAGSEVDLVVRVTVPTGWHVYSIHPAGESGPEPTRLEILSSHQPAAALSESPPLQTYDDALQQVVPVHKTLFELRQRIRIAEDQSAGYHDLRGQLAYQVCDNRICAPLQTTPFEAPLTIQ
jgi:DsbC/DsbD-like thiol-disulfide interchange protein